MTQILNIILVVLAAINIGTFIWYKQEYDEYKWPNLISGIFCFLVALI